MSQADAVDVFFSYERKGGEAYDRARGLADRLIASVRDKCDQTITIFVDEDSIGAGDFWEQRIQEALRESVVFVPLYTPSYLESDWCSKEYDYFVRAESGLRSGGLLDASYSLVVPVVVEYGEREDDVAEGEILDRQAIDVADLAFESVAFERRIAQLSEAVCKRLEVGDSMRKALGVFDGAAPSRRVEASVVAYSGADQRRVVGFLRDCRSVTVVGVANERLPSAIEQALEERNRQFGGRRFWDSFDVVFSDEGALRLVHDELSAEFAGTDDAVQQRGDRVSWAKRRLMSLFVREGPTSSWSIRSGSWLGHPLGYYFKFADRPDLALLEIPRPGLSSQESNFIELVGMEAIDLEAGFRALVAGSPEEHEIVLVGSPQGDERRFVCQGSKIRRSLLRSGPRSHNWVAAVVAATWTMRGTQPTPLLQLNLPRNSTREMLKISHVSGYVNLEDLAASGGSTDSIRGREVDEEVGRAAVERELYADFGIRAENREIKLVDTVEFYYHDVEDLYFHVYSVQVDEATQFSAAASMYEWNLTELASVRRFQSLSKLRSIAEAPLTEMQRRRALELLAWNLRADGLTDVAEELSALQAGSAPSDGLLPSVEGLAEEFRILRYPDGREFTIEGLAGLQYRSFYSHLVPLYADLGVEGASGLLHEIAENEERQNAVARISQLYADSEFIRNLGVEV